MRPAIERWDPDQLCFVGLDLAGFCIAIETAFRVCTDDGAEWRLDRIIGDRLWAVAIGVLPVANYEVEITMRREAEKRKEKANARR